ncbi:hypothetical protein INR49_019304 [Caranx melampygus]|nr:hypothetical protein INR49_019304 [Caranx melampygus]
MLLRSSCNQFDIKRFTAGAKLGGIDATLGPGDVLLAPEDTFLSAIINYTNSSTVHFKLSPTYVLYMACRYVLSPSYRPDMSPSERTHKVIAIVNKMVSMMEGVIQEIPEGDQPFIVAAASFSPS